MMKVYGRANSWNVRKVLFLLEELGLKYERLDYGRGFTPTTSPEFLTLNPNAMIPVIVDGDVVLWESHTILRYLAAKYGPESLYPRDLYLRGLVDQWLDWQLGHIAGPVRLLFFRHFLKTGDFSEREMAEAESESEKFFTILNGHLEKTGRYVTGPDFTIADCSIGMAAHRWLTLPLKRPALPALERYYALLSERPPFQKTVLIGMP